MTSTIPDIIRRYFLAYEMKDRVAIEALLNDDFIFSSPYDDRIGKAVYFEKCWPNSERIERFHIDKLFDKGDEAFVRYKLVKKTGGSFRNTEFFRFRDSRIIEVDVYFGRTLEEDQTQKRRKS